jgi:putative membrane protein
VFRFGGYGPGPGPGNGVGIFFFIMMVLVFAAVLWLLLASSHHRDVHGHASHHPGHPGHSGHAEHHRGPDFEAMRILERRFASGEIDDEEYLRRRKLLEGDS